MDSLNGPTLAGRIETLVTRMVAREFSVIAIVRSPALVDWAASEALLLATLVAEEKTRVILANLANGPLDRLAASSGPEGLTQALRGAVRVSEITTRLPGSGAFFFRAGEDRIPAADVFLSRAFVNLASRVGEGGGLILVYLPAEELPDIGEPGEAEARVRIDGLILLGDVAEDTTERLGAPILGRLDPPPQPEPADEAPAVAVSQRGPEAKTDDASLVQTATGGMAFVQMSDSGASRRAWKPRWRSDPGSPGPLQIVVIWVIAAAFVFLAWQAYAGWPVFENSYPDPAGEGVRLPARDSEAGDAGGPAPVDGADGAADSVRSQGDFDPMAAFGAAPEAPYSVLIASYTRWEDADMRRDQVDRVTDDVAFVAPTPLRGRMYYRVFVGASPGERQAADLMETLVAEGVKDESRAWDARPSRFAWLSGVFASRGEAAAESERLRSLELPVYIVHTGPANDRAYAVYSGAYESEEAAQPFGDVLRERGVPAQLVVRRGVSP
jgi:hypothetical protein